MDVNTKRHEEAKLLAAIADALPRLDELLGRVEGAWDYEDSIYRFYHQSFKVYGLQGEINEIVEALRGLAPHLPLNPWFMQIVGEGTAEPFSPEVNRRWLQATRPIVEAFFHARFFLQMVRKYGKKLKEPPKVLPSGWADVLYLYGLR